MKDIKPVTIQQRIKSLPHLVVVATLLTACCTPLLFWPPFIRSWLYSSLAMPKLFTLGGRPRPGRRPFGIAIWDWTHSHCVLLASAFFPVGVPLLLWWWLGLSSLWDGALENQMRVVQLLSATLFGSVAVVVFLNSQLQHILRPRIHVCFLVTNKYSEEGEDFLERYEYWQDFQDQSGTWIHLRITNVSPISYSGLSVSCELPNGWDGSSHYQEQLDVWRTIVRNRPRSSEIPAAEWVRPHVYRPAHNKIYFEKVDDPKDIGSGASAVFSFYAIPVTVKGQVLSKLTVFVSSNQTCGVTVKKLNVALYPKPTTN